jgi:hypothetical protein
MFPEREQAMKDNSHLERLIAGFAGNYPAAIAYYRCIERFENHAEYCDRGMG